MIKLIFILTIVCISTLNGMEPEIPKINVLEIYQSLFPELKQEIINTALATSKTPYEANKMIEKFKILGIKYNTFSDFNALMDILAKTFPDITRKEIAQKFDLPIAKEYFKLNNRFMKNIGELKHHLAVYELVDRANFTWGFIFSELKNNKNAKIYFNEIFKQLENIDPNFSQIDPHYPLVHHVTKTILKKIIYTAHDVSGATNRFVNHPDLIPIITALLNKGAVPDAQLIEMVEDETTINPTDLNKILLDLLKQAAGLDLMKRVPRDK